MVSYMIGMRWKQLLMGLNRDHGMRVIWGPSERRQSSRDGIRPSPLRNHPESSVRGAPTTGTSERAAWARSIKPLTRSSDARLRSSSCRLRSHHRNLQHRLDALAEIANNRPTIVGLRFRRAASRHRAAFEPHRICFKTIELSARAPSLRVYGKSSKIQGRRSASGYFTQTNVSGLTVS